MTQIGPPVCDVCSPDRIANPSRQTSSAHGLNVTRYLLDTHAAIWLLEGSSSLGPRARDAIEAEETVWISDISLLEIAMLAQRGRIILRPSAEVGLKYFSEQLTVLPISSEVAVDAVSVALPHRDPFDRVITATARVHDLTLITKDHKIIESGVVKTLW